MNVSSTKSRRAAARLRPVLRICLALLFLCLCLAAEVCAAAPDQDIIILYTNDVHCGVDDHIGYAGLSLYKKQMLLKTPYVALVDAGDAIQGAPMGSLTEGRAIIELMNETGYDVAVPGNHEFDYGMQTFLDCASRLRCGYIACNFMDLRSGKRVFDGSRILSFGDTRVGFVGVCTPESISKSTPKYFMDAEGAFIYGFDGDETGDGLYGAVQAEIDHVRAEGADYVILVGHLGEHNVTDRWSAGSLISHIHGADALIDGHSHEVTPEMEAVDADGRSIPVTQTGTKLAHIGKLTIGTDGSIRTELVDHVDAMNDAHMYTVRRGDTLGAIAKRELGDWQRWGEIYELNSEKIGRPERMPVGIALTIPSSSVFMGRGDRAGYGDPQIVKVLKRIRGDYQEALKTVLGRTEFDLAATRPDGEWLVRNQETNLGDLAADAFRAAVGADIGCINGGGLRADIRAGSITYNDVLTVMPFSNTVCMAEVTGQQILDCLELGASGYPEQFGGFLQVSGLTYTIDSKVPSSVRRDAQGVFQDVEGERRVKDVMTDDGPLDPARVYTLASSNYYLKENGDGVRFDSERILKDAVITDVDSLTQYIASFGGSVPEEYRSPDGQGRIRIE